MKRMFRLVVFAMFVVSVGLLAGCADDGSNGAAGLSAYDIAVASGAYTPDATLTDAENQAAWLASLDPTSPTSQVANVQTESCATCHAGVGDQHQAVYDDGYNHTITLAIDSVASTGTGPFDTTVTFTLMQNGLPYIDADGLPSFNRWYSYALEYNPAYTSEYDVITSFSKTNVVALGDGQYEVTATGLATDVTAAVGGVWVEVTQGPIEGTEGLHSEIAADGVAFNGADTIVSAANASGCSKCHGTPYGKHGYRVAVAGNLPDFAPCAGCHYAGRPGGHSAWQQSKDDPLVWAGDPTAVAKTTPDYAYEAIVMQDVHRSHAMEFPYPQSMANCVVCHEGKLTTILDDANFKLSVCKSCHWDEGFQDASVRDPKTDAPLDTTGLALATVIPHDWDASTDCQLCHVAGGIASTHRFADIHPGFNQVIYSAENVKYADDIRVAFDSATYDPVTMQMEIVATATAGTADAQLVNLNAAKWGLYAYDSDDLLASRLDATTAAGDAYISNASADSVTWTMNADLSAYAADIASGKVTRAQVMIQPGYTNGNGDAVALDAPSEIVKLSDGTFEAPVGIVDETKCNKCHEALATTFHSPDRGGNIEVCKSCHVATSGGSHLEMQSRSIDSYVHAIHSFEAFDREKYDFTSPYEAKYYEMHTEEEFYPLFTTLACESCHNEGTYNVPNQQVSLAALQSSAEANSTTTRNISDATPAAITGPASNACGGCHRAMFIKEDDANGLQSFNSHVKSFGYYIQNPSDTDLETVRDNIQTNFE